MIALQISGAYKRFDEQILFDNLNFQVRQGEKIGLIGRNGSGKTSMLRVIEGRLDLDQGQVFFGKDVKTAYLSQMPQAGDKTLIQYSMEAYEDVFKLEDHIYQLQLAMEVDPYNEALLREYGEKLDYFQEINGYAASSRVQGILRGLGFEEEDFSRKVSSLSGGEERRLYLARLLTEEADVLLLDEPTNHLDMEALAWLESYISNLSAAVVLVTHDREFLDRTVDKIFEIEGGRGRWYPGNYSAYREKKRQIYLQEQRAYERNQEKLQAEEEKLRQFRDRSHSSAKAASRARDREKKLERMEVLEAPLWISRNMNLRFKAAQATGQDILKAENLSKGYDFPLFKNLDFSVYKGDVIGIIGPNGSGKTTLMNLLAGLDKPDEGRLVFGPGVDRGYYRQHQEELSTSQDMVSFINNEFYQYNHGQIRSLLAQFLFTGEEVFKSINQLSGGEKARLRLLMLMLEERNLLLLDEPTNHLDIYSKETLEEALDHYEGTVILVSHDRYFLNRVCNRLLVLDQDRSALFEGNYSLYDEQVLSKRQEKAQEKRRKKPKKKVKKKSKPQEDLIEKELLELEEKLEEIELAFLDEEIYSDSQKIKDLSIKRDEYLQRIDQLYEVWGEEEEA